MRVVVLHNPIAGAGKAVRASIKVLSALRAAGHQTSDIKTRPGTENPDLAAALVSADVLVVIGGDGTVRQASGFAVDADVPICQLPFGTENLFAREFGMTRDIRQLVRVIESGERVEMDVGRVGEESFLAMVSVGFDADVIHDLTERRTGAISHWSYLGPITRQLLKWRPTEVGIEVDGVPLQVPGPGMVVVANTRHYAFRLDPLLDARRDDGLLHLMHLTLGTRLAMARLSAKCRLRIHQRDRAVTTAAGRDIRLTLDRNARYQIDGDSGRWATSSDHHGGPRVLDLSVQPGTLGVVRRA